MNCCKKSYLLPIFILIGSKSFEPTKCFQHNITKRETDIYLEPIDFGELLECNSNKECQEWIDNQYFCIKRRCTQKNCQYDSQCPGSNDRCIDQYCITITDCKTDNDCGETLFCNQKLGICTPSRPECIDPSECPPVNIECN